MSELRSSLPWPRGHSGPSCLDCWPSLFLSADTHNNVNFVGFSLFPILNANGICDFCSFHYLAALLLEEAE